MLPTITAGRRSMRWLPFAAQLAVFMQSAPPALAQQQPQVITVILSDRPLDQPLQFTPKTITLTVGMPVQLNIQNSGKQITTCRVVTNPIQSQSPT